MDRATGIGRGIDVDVDIKSDLTSDQLETCLTKNIYCHCNKLFYMFKKDLRVKYTAHQHTNFHCVNGPVS